MQFFTVKDLCERLNLYPCSDEKNYIHYNEGTLIEKIRKDFNGNKNYNKKKYWNKEEPMIFGICDGLDEYGTKKYIPYTKEVENFVKTVKTHSGGRNFIVMNESYFENCYFAIEKEYWGKKSDVFKRDTRAKIRDAISDAVETGNANDFRKIIAQILNGFLIRLNKKLLQ